MCAGPDSVAECDNIQRNLWYRVLADIHRQQWLGALHFRTDRCITRRGGLEREHSSADR